MTDKTRNDLKDGVDLESLFDAMRDDTPMPSGDFMARIEADALSALPDPVADTGRTQGIWSAVLEAVGGWPAAAGLAAACATGIWFGIYPPQTVSDFWSLSAETGTMEIDPLSGFDLEMMEG